MGTAAAVFMKLFLAACAAPVSCLFHVSSLHNICTAAAVFVQQHQHNHQAGGVSSPLPLSPHCLSALFFLCSSALATCTCSSLSLTVGSFKNFAV